MYPNYWDTLIVAVENLSKSPKASEAIFTIVFDELKKYEGNKDVLSPGQGIVKALNKIKTSMTQENLESISQNILGKIRFELGEEIKIQKKIGEHTVKNTIVSTLNFDDFTDDNDPKIKQ